MTSDNIADFQTLYAAFLEELMQHAYRPTATYRLQFNAACTFAQAQELVPYLYALGISDCYASPYFKARPGSTHGYDVINPQELNPAIGSPDEYDALVQTLRQHGMGQLLDIVPNHMGVLACDNPWWQDVLQHGQASSYARFFAIDWQPPKSALRHKVLLPVLGDAYGTVLERQELRLAYAAGQFELHYYEHRFPIAPCTTSILVQTCLEALQQQMGDAHPDCLALQRVLTILAHMPPHTERDPAMVSVRYRDAATVAQRLADLHDTSPAFRQALEQVLQHWNGRTGEPESFDPLHALLEAQPYRLGWWRVASDELNYRRFFDINHLAALRQEDPAVFEASHALVLDLVIAGHVTGLRIDHPDGLCDPLGYLQQLQRAFVRRRCQNIVARLAPGDDAEQLVESLLTQYEHDSNAHEPRAVSRPLYVVVEKILEGHERLPASWPVHGTTGYAFLNQLNGLFVDSANAGALQECYADFLGHDDAFADILYTTKKLIMETSMASEVVALGVKLDGVSETNRSWRDFTRTGLTEALREVIACFPVYRTYVRQQQAAVSAADRAVIDTAIAQARRRNPAMPAAVFDFLHDLLLLHFPAQSTDAERHMQLRFVQAFQQVTGPVMAKGLEDTAFYRYTPLASLNEVGGDLRQFGTSVAAFHQQNLARLASWPTTLLATSTHDTKRSEDVRARLNVLSEIPQAWHEHLWRWHRLNRPHQRDVDGQAAPSRQEEYLLYQTLLGAWPLAPCTAESRDNFRQRIQAYMRQALREAKVHTSWINPHAAYEQAMAHFVDALLDETRSQAFLADFATFQQTVAECGMWNALSQTLLKLTVPGVPDVYQGCELWDLSLVDPDNRRVVDYAHRQRLLTVMQ